MLRRSFLQIPAGMAAVPALAFRSGLRVATFSVDVTPPLRTPLCIGLVVPGERVEDPLSARGVVLFPERQKPIVLCSVDWLGIGNGGHDRWRAALAKAARTEPSRVAVHTVHQHDAPGDDASAQALLAGQKLDAAMQSEPFALEAIGRVAAAIRRAKPVLVTHIGAGSARVESIASNRRILGPDGKFQFQRYTACRNAPQCEAPEGVIDPQLKSVSFLQDGSRVATLQYYATHPMSHYGKGAISADFPGIARAKQRGTFAVYFTGAAGNIGAGKYNDGSPERRAVLADRLALAMERARANETVFPAEALRWMVEPVALPLRTGEGFSEAEIEKVLLNPSETPRVRANHARYLAWMRLVRAGRRIEISALRIGPAHIIHMPGELFVEYQLAANRERPKETVAMAAYGDYGPMYIGTAKAYWEGGYETSAVSRVAPSVEDVLMGAIRRVLA
ncbi:MAG: hypothetical protein JNL98_13780 [Bryobacterales bacterium]|nr:hypothetical protein [Bryobacterales bacterium]